MAEMNVRKGDNVMVIAGKDKGKAGKVLAVKPDTGRIYVEGVNIVSKSKKPRNAQDKGGILKQEGAIDAQRHAHLRRVRRSGARAPHQGRAERKDEVRARVRQVRSLSRREEVLRQEGCQESGEEKDRFQGQERRLTITEVYRGRKEKSGC